ncbi:MULTISPECIES: hypothetical protein [Nostoc]|nr:MULTISPECIES: hypothetical protein [Nostoc]
MGHRAWRMGMRRRKFLTLNSPLLTPNAQCPIPYAQFPITIV